MDKNKTFAQIEREYDEMAVALAAQKRTSEAMSRLSQCPCMRFPSLSGNAALLGARLFVGDVIDFTLTTGEEVQALAVKQEQDGMVMVLLDCLATEECMNKNGGTKGGFLASDLCKKLNGAILGTFPTMIRRLMIPFANGLFLRLPTEKEIFGENKYGKAEAEEVKQWEPMKLRRNRIALQGKNGDWEWYWLDNVVKDSAADFAGVTGSGNCFYYGAGSSRGVRPAFKIYNL